MATYNELRGLFATGDLKNRVEVAVIVKAHAIIAEATPSADRLAWAEAALASSTNEAAKFLKYVLAANKGSTVENIQTANDTAIQTAVDAAVDKLHP